MVERSSIVTREKGKQADMIRFVIGPDSAVMPDIKGNLPGRGAWVELSRSSVEKAVAAKAFARSFKQPVKIGQNLAEQIDDLLVRSALASLAMARRGGCVVTGAAQVEAVVRVGKAVLVLHATEAAADGRRKIAQAAFAAQKKGRAKVAIETLFDEQQMSIAFGADHVIHVALLQGLAGNGFIDRLQRLKKYRGEIKEVSQ